VTNVKAASVGQSNAEKEVVTEAYSLFAVSIQEHFAGGMDQSNRRSSRLLALFRTRHGDKKGLTEEAESYVSLAYCAVAKL
jgi:hypothetical protein